MGKKIGFVIIWLFCIFAASYIIVWADKQNYSFLSVFVGGVTAFFIERAIKAFEDISDNNTWKESQRKLMRGGLLKSTSLVRISFAYLFRIKVNNMYLLIKNERGTGKYQPVGGVYKYNDSERNYLKSKYKIADDYNIPNDASSKDDYRLLLPCKYLRKFVKRFNSNKSSRERIDDVSREFKEELGNVLKWDRIKYRYCGCHMTELGFSSHYQCYELLLADIVELIPTEAQLSDLEALMHKRNAQIHFSTTEEIKSLGVKIGTNKQKESIADHSFKILQENEQHLMRILGIDGVFEVLL